MAAREPRLISVADLLTYRGIVAEVAPGQTAEAAECIFWLKNRRYATIVPHIEFRIGAHTSKRTVEQRVSDKADYLRRLHRAEYTGQPPSQPPVTHTPTTHTAPQIPPQSQPVEPASGLQSATAGERVWPEGGVVTKCEEEAHAADALAADALAVVATVVTAGAEVAETGASEIEVGAEPLPLRAPWPSAPTSLISSRTRSRGACVTNLIPHRITPKPAQRCPVGSWVRRETECGRHRFNAEDGQVISIQKRQRVVRFEDGSLRTCALSELLVDDIKQDDDSEVQIRVDHDDREYQASLPPACPNGEDRSELVDPLEGLPEETLQIVLQNAQSQ